MAFSKGYVYELGDLGEHPGLALAYRDILKGVEGSKLKRKTPSTMN